MKSSGKYMDRGGTNQIRVRDYNERLTMSLVRRNGAMSKSEITQKTGLSAQTISVIMRSLEQDGLLIKGQPRRGRVGQPSVPMSLNPHGALSFGLKVGRRSSDLVLVDFLGNAQFHEHFEYAYPDPNNILAFATRKMLEIKSKLSDDLSNRITGMGVAMPFELWNWSDPTLSAPADMMAQWKDADFINQLSEQSGLDVFTQNDATAACGAELYFGRGNEWNEFIYFFIGTFVGGGIVINNSLYPGRTGNAGALGSLPIYGTKDHKNDKSYTQLIDAASVSTLEAMLIKSRNSGDGSKAYFPSWSKPQAWEGLEPELDDWIDVASKSIATAIISASSIIDFQAAVIDGNFPEDIREKFVKKTQKEILNLDPNGIEPPQIVAGTIGTIARAIGGATLPLNARYLINDSVLFKESI